MSTLTNEYLRRTLQFWVTTLDRYVELSPGSERDKTMHDFCVSFVPEDMKESTEDILYFEQHLTRDMEFLLATRRELRQCATGDHVESIKGDQRKRAVFTLLPTEDVGNIDIVREVTFVSVDGIEWTAEG